jgi:hypothetical protein
MGKIEVPTNEQFGDGIKSQIHPGSLEKEVNNFCS